MSGDAQLLVFMKENVWGYVVLHVSSGNMHRSGHFNKLDGKLHKEEKSWENGVHMYRVSWHYAKYKKQTITLCFVSPSTCEIFTLHQALASKSLNPELHNVLKAAVKMVNFIKSRPVRNRLFTTLCREMGLEHESLLFLIEVR